MTSVPNPGEPTTGASPLFQAERSLQTIGQLAAGIVHEVNTPAQFVADNIYFMQRTMPGVLSSLRSALAVVEAVRGDARVADLVQRLDADVERLRLDYVTNELPKALAQSQEGLTQIAAIVHSMKLFSRPSMREMEDVDLPEAIEACITIARNEWKYVAEVETKFADGLKTIRGYREQLQQVFLNLIINAGHAIKEKYHAESSQAKGCIQVEVHPDDEIGGVVVVIRDDGNGIPEEVRDRIFHPFFTTKPPGIGTGQGLAIAWTVVVERHGGHLDFDSEVGIGTTFRVHLPNVPPTED